MRDPDDPNADTIEALFIFEIDDQDGVDNVYAMHFSPMVEGTEHTLVGVDRENAEERFAQITCVSIIKGTRITLSSGALKPNEEVDVGKKTITRDKGFQEVRWIGQSTLRATGDFAPVVIKVGALKNMHGLIFSPEQRLFVYQRQDKLGTGRAETLVGPNIWSTAKTSIAWTRDLSNTTRCFSMNIESSMPTASPPKPVVLSTHTKRPAR